MPPPVWHPLTLGHELAHLKYTKARAIGWLATRESSGRGELVADAVELAKSRREPTVPTPWFQALVSWLTEVACDTSLAYYYGDEGLDALGSHLSVHARRDDSPSHPSPELRLAIQAADGPEELRRFNPSIAHQDEAARRRTALIALALECRDSVKGELERLGSFSAGSSDSVAESATSHLEQGITPVSQSWERQVLLKRPVSIETGLVRALLEETGKPSRCGGELAASATCGR